VEIVADGVLRLDGGEEVGGDELSALMDELGGGRFRLARSKRLVEEFELTW
jgi:hypothetical protein